MGQDPTRTTGDERDAPSFLLDRREFLRLAAAAGIAASAVASSHPVAAAASPAPSPRATDPIGDLAAALGHDRDRLFRFVADEVRYEPYVGVLRGAKGTLLARAGNSADQALLLADLLTASGIPVRFVSGPLGPATSTSLIASTITDAETAQHATSQAVVSEADVAAGIDWLADGRRIPADAIAQLPGLEEFQAALGIDQAQLGPGAAAVLQRTLDVLLPALAGAGVSLPTAVTGLPATEEGAHVWLQAGDGAAWMDLDPSIPGAVAGTPVTTASAPYTEVPHEQRHVVDFAVIAESLQGSTLVQDTILQASAFADELAHAAVVFSHLPSAAFADIPILGGIGAGFLYRPVLLLGDSAAVATRPVSIGGSGGDLFGGALGGGGDGLVDGETGAEWLEVTVTPPGAEPRVARRAIFDRVGSAMRDSGAIDLTAIPPAELVDTPDGETAQYLPCRAVRALSVTSAPPNLKALIEGVTKGLVSLPALFPGVADALRYELTGGIAAAAGSRPFGDSPSVFGWSIEETPAGDLTERLDIWHRSVGSLAVSGATPVAPPALVAGVMPHVVERLATGEVSASGEPVVTDAASVGAIFDATVAQGITPLVFSGALPADFPFQGDIRAAIEGAVGAGWTVVTPGRVAIIGGRPRLGWWRVDPTTGVAVDEMDDGGGQSEKVIVSLPYLVSAATTVGWRAFQSSYPYLEDAQIGAKAQQLLRLLMALNPGWY